MVGNNSDSRLRTWSAAWNIGSIFGWSVHLLRPDMPCQEGYRFSHKDCPDDSPHSLANILSRSEKIEHVNSLGHHSAAFSQESMSLIALDNSFMWLGDFGILTDVVWDCEQIDLLPNSFIIFPAFSVSRLQWKGEYSWGRSNHLRCHIAFS